MIWSVYETVTTLAIMIKGGWIRGGENFHGIRSRAVVVREGMEFPRIHEIYKVIIEVKYEI